MKKEAFLSVLTMMAVALGVMVFHHGLTSASDGAFPSAQTAPKDPIVLAAKMGNVTFSHASVKHAALACEKCHHKAAADGNKTPKCTSCHTETSTVKVKDAFHKTCQDCHKADLKANPASKAPTKCNECHKK